jgi:hypothetical protein
MCDGVEVEVSACGTSAASTFLNVLFATPGCMKTVGGALGHTYDCKYEADSQSFQWAHSLEESFRVAELTCDRGAVQRQSQVEKLQ